MEPKIRLKGFSGEWEEKPLLDVVTLYNGLTYNPSDIRDRGTLVLRSSNVQEGEIALSDNVYVKSDVATSPNVEKGDIIVVVRNGSRALIGKHAQIKEDMPNTVIGAFMAGMHTDEPEFMNALLSTSSFDDEVNINLGATINQITNGTFRSMKFHFPKKDEQKAIGAYFQHLDSLIQSTTKKIESLKQVKAASLQSMFPQEGETTPRVRFKGFEGEWEKVSLNSLCRNAASQLTESTLGEDKGCYPVFGASGYLQNIEEYAFDIPYIGIIKDGSGVGRSQLYPACSSILGTMQYIIPNSGIDASYLACVFEGIDFTKFITGSTIPHIYFKDYCTLQLMMPSEEEQKKIGQYFTNLDSQITLQTQRLEKLKQIKSACLDNMFV